MPSRLAALSLVLPALGCAAAPARTQTAEPFVSSLPVRTVRLYETGVGYFERAGRLQPGSDTIALPAAKVDDALKTLLVLSDGAQVRVSAVEFPSVLSEALARVQAGLSTQAGRPLTYPLLLRSLRGMSVEVTQTNGALLSGRLVEVNEISHGGAALADPNADPNAASEPREAPAAARPVRPEMPRYAVTVLAREGGVVRLDSERIRSVRPTDPAIAARLDSAVGTASERGAQAPRLLKISATGAAPVRIGYITETPVWRVTYRLLLSKNESAAALQGWVLVHNDGDEPWRRVALEIVNGRPDSFLYPLTAPRYSRRPLATPETEMSTLPQLARRTADQLWGDHDESLVAEGGEAYGAGGLGLSGIGEGGGGQGFGAGHGRLGGSHRTLSPSATSEIEVGNLAQLAGSRGLASGAEFRYRMLEPVSLSAHSSALVPFTQVTLGAEAMTRFTWGESEGRLAARITNSSSQTLPAGPVAFYSPSGLAGESALGRLVAGAELWLRYGVDLDVEVERPRPLSDVNSARLARFDEQRRLVVHYVRRREQPLHIENRSGLARKVCVELPVVDNAKVLGADRLLYDVAAKRSLGVFELRPRSALERTMVFEEGLKRATELAELTRDQLQELASGGGLEASARPLLLEAADFLARGPDPKQREDLKEGLARLETDRQRLQQTIDKLKGTSGNGAEPLVRRLVELETRRNRLENEQKALSDVAAQRLPALAAILQRLNPATAKPKAQR